MTGHRIAAAVLAGALLAACSTPTEGRVTGRRYTPPKTTVVLERCQPGDCVVRPVPVSHQERWSLSVVDVVEVRDVEVTQGEWASCPPGSVWPRCAGGER